MEHNEEPIMNSTSKNPIPAPILKELRRIPGVGPSLAQDLFDLGVKRVSALRNRNPESLYNRLCTLRGEHQDRCVLYVFRCAVYFATEAQPDPEHLKWWNWKDSRTERGNHPKANPNLTDRRTGQ
jgi:hypothetical protein